MTDASDPSGSGATSPQTEAAAAAGGSRLVVFDVIRGFFMAMIATVHLLQNLQPELLASPAIRAMSAMLIGTVGFVTVSGILVGHFFDTRPGQTDAIIRRYRKQAIRLLLIAHPLIVLALYGWKSGRGGPATDFLWRSWFVTDTLAVIFLVIVPVIPRLGSRARLALGVVMLVAARLIFVWRPGGSNFSYLLTDVLAGADPHGHHVLNEDYPLLSLAGMFVIGAWIGRDFSRVWRSGDRRVTARRYLRWVLFLVLMTWDFLGMWALLRRGPQGRVRAFFYPDYYLSTYPLYLAAVLGLTALIANRSLSGPLARSLAVFGRTSLFIYVAQYYVMQTIPFMARWRHHMTIAAAGVYLAGGLVLLNLAGRAFERGRHRRGEASALVGRSPPPGGAAA